LALLPHPYFEPLPDPLQHPPIADPSGDQAHEQGVIDGVTGVVEVCIHHPPSPDEGLVGTTLRSKAVGGVLAVGLEDGLDPQRARLLHHPVPAWGNPPGALPPVGLGNVHSQHWLRAILPSPQVVPDVRQTLLHPVALHRFDGHAIAPGRSARGAHLLPGPPQHVGPEEAAIPRTEPAVPAPRGRPVASALEWS
jgi:hypothetical protein